ncbi:hypothetical protein NY2A_b607R [Paramecium bursaria Chlorella virus NY2A]|uniref:Uncharacterized protein b607R n=2 Tax=Chlorovirus TaxID=181083 RepID=A7IXD2_PBCVN|nr:hypothetical protein NY2A_b607R [Paramecium bursaria Chlorella virus NY2A]ABT15006.1 hypothetical protein NY2A_b607R [Paramecium bursaria Chlorella virus NY2A]
MAFFSLATLPPDLITPMSSRDLTTPSVSSRTTDFRHFAIYCLASLTSIIAPKSYNTKVPSFLIPMLPA